jgi:hypothetical protein
MTVNSGDGDAFIKLKNQAERTILSFYVKANSTATIENIPDGQFTLSWASGRNFSRECGLFFQDMSASSSPDTINMRSGGGRYSIYRFTLRSVVGGNLRPRDMPLNDFLRD